MWTQYFISLFNFQLFHGFLANYAASKDAIQKQFSLSETFFGMLDMFNLIFRVILAGYIIVYPFKKLQLTNFTLSLLQCIGIAIMSLAHFFPQWHKPLLIMGVITSGIGRANIALIYLISYENIKPEQNKKAFNIWSALNISGVIYGLLLCLLFIYILDFSWASSIMIYNLIYLASSLIFFLVLKEVEMAQQNRSLSVTIQQLYVYYGKKHSNWLLLLDFVLLSNTLMTQGFWSSYFFSKIGFKQASIYISFGLPIGLIIGSFTVLLIINKYYQNRQIITIIISIMNLLIIISSLFVGNEYSDALIYTFLFFCIMLLEIGPYSLASGTQFSQKTQNTQQRYLVMSFMRLSRQLFTGICMIIVGALMDINDYNYLNFLIANYLLYMIIHILRRYAEYKQTNQHNSYQSLA